jgi:hypothetical protein
MTSSERLGAGWDPTFFLRSPLFWPVERAARALQVHPRWPDPEDLTGLFEGEPPARFEPAPPRPRRGHKPAPEARYDARIALARRVPTRARSWHDLMNALVWATFPGAKAALHARQHAIIAARLGRDLRLPGTRTREQDALAMLDEGGVALLCARARRPELDRAIARDSTAALARLVEDDAAAVVVFGHAIYEALVCGRSKGLRAVARIAEVDAIGADASACVRAADDALAGLLSRADPVARDDFVSIAVDERLARAPPEPAILARGPAGCG